MNINEFDEKGFTFIEKLIPNDKIDELYDAFVYMMIKFSGKDYTYLLNDKESWDSIDFSQAILDFRNDNYAGFSYLYRTMIMNHIYTSLFTYPKLTKAIAQLLKTRTSFLTSSDPQFRIDHPKDKKHTLRWHQDSAYYPQDQGGDCSLVCNISLHNIPNELGPVEVKEGSHKSGKIKFSNQTPKGKKSGQKYISENLLKDFRVQSLCTQKGDVSLYHMNLVHKSGFNVSDSVRFSAILRFYDVAGSNFVPFDVFYRCDQNYIEKLK